MTQAVFTPTACKFGNMALPNGQGTLSWINLNDYEQTFLTDPGIGSSGYQNGVGHQTWFANGNFVSYDVLTKTFKVLGYFYEGTSLGGPGIALGAFVAKLSQSGTQQLTFDGNTAVQVRFNDLAKRSLMRPQPPYWWNVEYDFLAAGSYFQDLTATSTGAQSTPGGTSGTGTFTSIPLTYNGSVWTSPTITVATNSAATIKYLVINFQQGQLWVTGLPGGAVATTITIDCANWKVTDQAGNLYDVGGSFPQLYGPVGFSNPLGVYLGTSVAAAGATTTVTWFNRWEI